jgi:hypothetical protein
VDALGTPSGIAAPSEGDPRVAFVVSEAKTKSDEKVMLSLNKQ